MAFMETEINILTLNCWGLGMGISKVRTNNNWYSEGRVLKN